MVAFADDLRSILGAYKPASTDAITLKVEPRPLMTAGDTGGTASQVQSTGGASAGGSVTASVNPQTATPTPSATATPKNQLSVNPQLVTHPLGAQTDAEYEAAVNQLAFNTQSQYASILRELGMIDSSGNFVPGALEIAAARKRQELEYQQGLARDAVTQGAQRQGTLFSGRRGVLQAQAEQPYVSGLAGLESDLAGSLQDRYTQATDLLQKFTVDRDALIAAAAQRAAARIQSNPTGNAAVTAAQSSGDPNGYNATLQPSTIRQINASGYTPYPLLPDANVLMAFK